MTSPFGSEYIDRIEAGFSHIEKRISDIDDRLRNTEMVNAQYLAPTGTRLDAAWRKIDEHSAELSELQRDLAQLTSSVRQLESILRWFLGIITSVLCAILVGLSTGHLAISVVP